MKKFIIFIVIIVVLIGGFTIMNNSNSVVEASAPSSLKKNSNENEEIKKKDTKDAKVENTKIKVDIKGSVVSPDVYEVDSNARVIDQTTPNMIQRISGIFERNPLISKEI